MGSNSTLHTLVKVEPTIEQKTSPDPTIENQVRVAQLVRSVTEKLRMPRNDRTTSYSPRVLSETQIHDLWVLSRFVLKRPITHLLFLALENFLVPHRPFLRQVERLNGSETTKEIHRLEKINGAKPY